MRARREARRAPQDDGSLACSTSFCSFLSALKADETPQTQPSCAGPAHRAGIPGLRRGRNRQNPTAAASNARSAARPASCRSCRPNSTSEHALEARTRRIAYTATAGTLPIFDQSGERKAAVFYTSYVARDANAASRPVTFVFNGGPGAASVYLHLGVVGPKILDFGPTGRDGAVRAAARQSRRLARLHRPRPDRSAGHRLEPHRQAGRQELLGRAR